MVVYRSADFLKAHGPVCPFVDGASVAVSRPGPGSTGGIRRSLLGRSFLAGAVGAAFVVVASASPATAGPEGATVVGGSVVISGEGTKAVTVDQFTQRAIIDWRSYSIGVDESVRYRQPGSDSISLNRDRKSVV